MVDSEGGHLAFCSQNIFYWHLVFLRQDCAHISLAQIHNEISPSIIDPHVMLDSLFFSLTYF
jgi:hypothetical protein